MRCPFCGFQNSVDVEVCESCFKFMSRTDSPDSDRELADAITHDPLALLNPVPPVTVEPTTAVAEAVRLLAVRNIGCVLVVENGTLLGIFSERDALRRIGSRYYELADQPISRFMTPTPETLTPHDPIAFALNRMDNHDYRHVPIQEDGEVVGVISVRDCIAYVTEHFPELKSSTN
jgi:CBS domain-containing protein